jgi:hemoglobin-like flavoprotein
MTSHDKALVQSSWRKVVPIADTAAELFYGRLFETAPQVRALFHGDMKEQGRKLMQMLALAVNCLDRLDDLAPALRSLGSRHVAYGVRDADYDPVGAALLWTLAQGLGEEFTPEVKDAWARTYATLAGAMKEASAAAA